MADRYARSRAFLDRARHSLTGGVSSPFRAQFPVPLYFESAAAAHLTDVDGNHYIDYALAWGPLILGHCHPAVVEAVSRSAQRPHLYGAQHELEFEVSERIQRMVPCAERVAFTSSGSEAVQCALRLARAATGRTLVLKFEGHYHGWMDSVLIGYRSSPDQLGAASLDSRGQVPNAAANALVAEWNDLTSVERLFAAHPNAIAAVIAEPVLCNSGCLMPAPGFLESLRALTASHGALLIFDEIITGFRIAPGGAQAAFKVTPDLATFGKALGGGLPLSAIAGRAGIMELMIDGGVSFGGTFNGNPLSLAAAQATLDEICRHDAAALQHANRLGRSLMQGFEQLGVTVTGFGAAFSLHFPGVPEYRTYRDFLKDDKSRLHRFLRAMLDEGIYLLPDGRFYLSAAHTEADIARTLAAAARVLSL
ncbi:MAG: aspartate aminotransferase family protein [Bryobacteraceae bacterium]|nr:aspartate aminotransferase family protein [Bryobacteraceae bacterium]